jgi:amidohydrolase
MPENAGISIDSFVSIPDAPRATLQGTLSCQIKAAHDDLVQEIERVCSRLSQDSQARFNLSEIASQSSTGLNNARATTLLKEVSEELLGAENVLTVKRDTWLDDFKAYTNVTPGAFMFLGAQIPNDRRSHHTPTFDIDESCLVAGAAVLAATAWRLLGELT